MSLELSGQDWSFVEESFAEPSIPVEGGGDQSIYDHLVQSGLGWAFHTDAETNPWVRMWEFPHLEDDQWFKTRKPSGGLDYDEGIQAPSRGEIKLKVRKRG